jgi:uncharacterized protein (DUF1684 family)
MKNRFLIFFLIFLSCSQSSNPEYYEDWKIKRKHALYAEDGFLNLAGLYQIEDGKHTMGSAEGNDMLMPNGFPDNFAEFAVKDSIITFKYYVPVLFENKLITEISYNYFKDSNFFDRGSFRWFVHVDSGVIGIRLRNFNHPLLKSNLEIEFFKYNSKYNVNAIFKPFKNPKKTKIPNFQGGSYYDTVPGKIYFNYEGTEYSFEPTVRSSGRYFIAFGDLTNGESTYGGGRFLYLDPPDINNKMTIDFNMAYNPPCVFSTFTTCPLPPKENILPVAIAAGELDYNGILFSSVYQ